MDETNHPRFKWSHGCISLDEKVTSRDSATPEYFKNEEELKKAIASQLQNYHSMGYKFWYSIIEEWDGKKYTKREERNSK